MPPCSSRLSTAALPRGATATLQGSSPVTALALSASWLLVGRADGETCLRPAAPAPRAPAPRRLPGHQGTVLAVALTPNGALAITAGADGTVRCWNTATGALTSTLELGPPSPRRARFKPPQGVARAAVLGLDVSPRGDLLATAGWDGRVRLWHLPSGAPAGEPVVSGRHGARFARFSPRGDLLMVGFETLTLRAYAVPGGAPRGMFDGHLDAPLDGAFLPSAPSQEAAPPRFASLAPFPMLQIWDVAERESLRKYTPETARWFRATKDQPFTALAPLSPAPSGHGPLLALSRGGEVLVVSLGVPRDTQPRRLRRGHEGTVTHLAAGPPGLASGDDRGRVVLWSPRAWSKPAGRR